MTHKSHLDKIKNLIHFNIKNLIKHEALIIGMTRIRNESLLIRDSLDHLARLVDGIVVFDDASNDDTVEICQSHPSVLEVVQNKKWNDSSNRSMEETLQRQQLLLTAKKYNPTWLIYLDADERLEGDIRDYLLSDNATNVSAIKVRLFDAYMTETDSRPYKKSKLYKFRKYFGPECRDILMIWRNNPNVSFIGEDAREPKIVGKSVNKFFCQHYGKSLSVEHWEETCDYYIKHFPQYSLKWKKRKGKAIHSLSDFGNKLYPWKKVKEVGKPM